ncbi:hypothetical protein AWB83_00111 [Caballeronia ptereochthonis]|uniref:Uncharacterized protein n=1 Tax=Caballeronia ptereochthonis TaxID=1777144 RepID=A0A157Z3X3_9BURK|nr:hypothetical protein AWB83_00111 [Caballeronia ptereochthonis]
MEGTTMESSFYEGMDTFMSLYTMTGLRIRQ